MAAPFADGQLLLADRSAWERAGNPTVIDRWEATIDHGSLATCSIVMLEMLYATRTIDEFAALDRALRDLIQVPVNATVMETALAAMRELVEELPRKPRFHRLPPPDYIVAAAAAERGCGVIHYDRDYDRLATVLGFDSHWIAEPGSLD